MNDATPNTPSASPEAASEATLLTMCQEQLKAAKQEAAEFKDKYLRLLADSENMRKRLHKEKQEMTAYSLQQMVASFLAPLDHFENALKFTTDASEEVKHWALGFQMILTQFKDVLLENGVEGFNSLGMPFDPHLHEAVETAETPDKEAGIVLEEFIKGYKMGEKTIRPARVKVSK
jgi:molecular chaperone GrpE